MNIVNLTPHALNIQTEDGSMIEIVPSGNIARVTESREEVRSYSVFSMEGAKFIPVTRSTYGEITGLPEPVNGTIYVVSGLVLARTSRPDVFAPGEAVRDTDGKIIGCKGLSASQPNTVAEDVKELYNEAIIAINSYGYGTNLINFMQYPEVYNNVSDTTKALADRLHTLMGTSGKVAE